jgi:hypothetical protein
MLIPLLPLPREATRLSARHWSADHLDRLSGERRSDPKPAVYDDFAGHFALMPTYPSKQHGYVPMRRWLKCWGKTDVAEKYMNIAKKMAVE